MYKSSNKMLKYFHGIRALVAINMAQILCLLPLPGFSDQEFTLLSFEGSIDSSRYEQQRKEISFVKTAPIHVHCSYPVFSGEGILVKYANQQLRTEAENRFDCFVKEEILSEEVYDEECELSHVFFPVYQANDLISSCGVRSEVRWSHGCTYYEGKTFWRKGDSVVELVLDDLFVKGREHRNFLLQYCENYFKSSGYGYYSSLPEFPPELDQSDLDIFVITDKGLKIVFRACRVGGWADGPDTVLIPYAKLREYIDSDGPLKALLN
jgi:hypothetical protein